MTTMSLSTLVESLQRFRLLEAHQLEELAEIQGQFAEPQALLGELVRRGWLTTFQAKQLLQGRGQHLVFGPYRILERLGSGGNGQVFKAWHDTLQRLVALKVLRKDLLADADAVGRFFREVEVLSHVSHPAIVHAYNAGVVGVTHYLSMEYVDGFDLERMVRQSGRLPAAQACDYIRQAAQGLQHAHEKGLIHRDIKPSNLLVTGNAERGTGKQFVKILDLGLARLQEPAATSKTRNLTVLAGNSLMLGTPDYLAPEQALDFHSADIRSDIYSLGCTFYFLLTGEPPFPGGGMHQKLIRHQQEQPPSLEAARDDLPPGLTAIVEKMLAKHPDDRYQTPGEVAQALAALNGSAPSVESASTVSVPLDKTPASGIRVGKSDAAPPSSAVQKRLVGVGRQILAGPRRWYVLGGAAVLLLGIAGVVALFWSGPSKPVADARPSAKAVEAKRWRALQFNGDQVVVLPPNLFRNADKLTLEAWFKTTGDGVLFGYQNKAYPAAAPGDHVPILYVGKGGWLNGEFWNGAVKPLKNSGPVNDGRWHHVCLVADGPAKLQTLYLDGNLVGKLPGAINHSQLGHNQIGTGYAKGWPGCNAGWFGFKGTIAEVRVWYAVRTPDQVRQGMQTAPKETETDLAVYYPMNELEGDSLTDRSGRGRNLDLGLPGNRNQPTRVTDHPANKP